MKGKGTFRGFVNKVRRTFGLSRKYADPVFQDPRDRKKKRAHGHAQRARWRVKESVRKGLPSDPGTITYHDKLVRHFGRRRADAIGRLIQQRKMDQLPSEQDFIDNPPWAFLNER